MQMHSGNTFALYDRCEVSSDGLAEHADCLRVDVASPMKSLNIVVLLAGFFLAATAIAASPTIRWDDNSSNEVGFELQRADGTAPAETAWVTIVTTAANAAIYVDTSAVDGALYSYRVRAVTDHSMSAWSNVTSMVAAPSGISGSYPAPLYSLSLTSGDSLTVKGSPNPTRPGSKTINVPPGRWIAIFAK